MKKNFTFHCIMSACVFMLCAAFFSSCVDKDYDLNSMDEISTQVTIATEGIVAPIVARSRQTVDSLLGDEADEYLTVGDDGVYKLTYGDRITGAIEDLAIDPITDMIPELESQIVHLSADDIELPEHVKMKEVRSSFEVDIPNFDMKESIDIREVKATSAVKIPEGLGAGVSIDAGSIPELTLTVKDNSVMSASAELIDEISYVRRVEFGATEAGAVVSFLLDAGSFSPVYSGGTIRSFTVNFPAGYELGLADSYGGRAELGKGPGSETFNIFRLNDYALSASQPVKVDLYLKYVELQPSSVANGVLSIDDEIGYDLDFVMKTKSGTIASGDGPRLGVEIEPVFRDAVVVTKDFQLSVKDWSHDFRYDVSGISKDIKRVDYVALSGKNILTVKASNLDLPFQGADFNVDVALPQVLVFESSPYISSGNILSAPASALMRGVDLSLTAINLQGSEKGEVDENGVLALNEKLEVDISHTIPSGAYRLSDISTALGSRTCEIGVGAAELSVDRMSCVFVLRSISSDIDMVEKFDYSMRLPDEIKSIDRLYVESVSGDRVCAKVKMSVSDSPVDEVYVENLTVSLPDMLMISGPDVVDNTIRITQRRIAARADGMVDLAEFEITGLKNLPVEDGCMNIDDEISVVGTVRTIEGEVIDGLNGDVVVTPVISVPDIKVVKFEGKVDFDLKDYVETPSVDLSDLTEKLSDVSLGLVDPSLKLSIANPVGIALRGNVILHPVDRDGKPMKDLVVRDIFIAAADEGGNAVTRIFITPLQGVSMPGYDTYCTPELLDLLRNLPSRIDVDLQLALDDEQTHSLYFDRDYVFDVDYSVEVPLRLDSTTSIVYSDDLDLDGVFDDILDKGIRVQSVKIVLEVRSTVPLALDLSARLTDEYGGDVDGIDFSLNGSIAGYDAEKDGAEKFSRISAELKLRNGNLDYIVGAKKLHLGVSGTSMSASGLRPEQYIEIGGYAEVRKISVDADKF